jgi:hypothetical protein
VQIDGRGVKIATDYYGTKIWLVTANQQIFYRDGINGVWDHVNGSATQVAVSGNGLHVWVVNKFSQVGKVM